MTLDPITTLLTSRLDKELRIAVLNRRENMLRELRYLEERRDQRLEVARQQQWTKERFEALCGLNSFYQLVLGPLASSARERFGTLGSDVPILYGETLRFDSNRNARINAAHASFMSALTGVPDASQILTAPRFEDMLFRLVRFIEEHRDDYR